MAPSQTCSVSLTVFSQMLRWIISRRNSLYLGHFFNPTFRRRQQGWVDQGQCLLKKSRFLNPVKRHKSVSQLRLLQALKWSVHMVNGLLEQDNQETNCPICLETIAPGEQV